jgi:hypothetical protein
MEIKVRAVEGTDNKSKAQIEEQLLEKHADSLETEEKTVVEAEKISIPQDTSEDTPKEETTEEQEKTPSSELNDENVLSFLKNRYNKEINSVDELFAEKEANEPLPEDVSAYLKYKQETGRGISDFYNLQKDYNTMDDNALLADYVAVNEEGLDAIDVQDILEEKFSFDEELDEPKEVKKKKLAKKRELAKAKKFFNEQKDKYKIPLESSGGGLSEDQEKNLNAYKKYIEDSKSIEEINGKKYKYFLDETRKVFSTDFKGFDFQIGEENLTFKPGTAQELFNVQKDVNNFIGKYVDKEGVISDPVKYHRALAVAINPEKFAQFFYDQGASSVVDNVAKKSKNINMDIRKSPRLVTKDGLKIRAVESLSSSSGRGLKIRSINKV